jgi:hypothetical protein
MDSCSDFVYLVSNSGYTRFAFDSVTGIVFHDFPILRFECNAPAFFRRKGKHRTFSLLPAQLIPYERYDITFVLNIVQSRLSGSSLKNISDAVANEGVQEPLLLEARKIRSFITLVGQAFDRLPLISSFKSTFLGMLTSSASESLMRFITWGKGYCSYVFPELTGPAALALDFYRSSLPHVFFLFGTPSQQR